MLSEKGNKMEAKTLDAWETTGAVTESADKTIGFWITTDKDTNIDKLDKNGNTYLHGFDADENVHYNIYKTKKLGTLLLTFGDDRAFLDKSGKGYKSSNGKFFAYFTSSEKLAENPKRPVATLFIH